MPQKKFQRPAAPLMKVNQLLHGGAAGFCPFHCLVVMCQGLVDGEHPQGGFTRQRVISKGFACLAAFREMNGQLWGEFLQLVRKQILECFSNPAVKGPALFE